MGSRGGSYMRQTPTHKDRYLLNSESARPGQYCRPHKGRNTHPQKHTRIPIHPSGSSPHTHPYTNPYLSAIRASTNAHPLTHITQSYRDVPTRLHEQNNLPTYKHMKPFIRMHLPDSKHMLCRCPYEKEKRVGTRLGLQAKNHPPSY